MTPHPSKSSHVGWHEVHRAHGEDRPIRLTFQGRVYEGPVTAIFDDSFEMRLRDSLTTFIWFDVEKVEVAA